MPDNPTESAPTLPDAIQPYSRIGEPNEPFELYAGPIELTQKGVTFLATGRIELSWLPSPAIRFRAHNLPADAQPELEDIALKLDDGTTISHCFVTGLDYANGPDGFSANISGNIAESVTRPADGPVLNVVFLLPNFQRLHGRPVRYSDGGAIAGRCILSGDPWVITIDPIQNQRVVVEFLDSDSGFGITHVGRLERVDGKLFTASDARTILEGLTWYVSYAAGRWTGPCLPAGFDANGKQVWQLWHHTRTAPFRRRRSWLDLHHGSQFEGPFAGFLKRWLDEEWNEIIRVAIHWYIEANAQAGSIEGSIVLTQTAFELLASAVLVEHYSWLSTDGYDKIGAADRIRLLFLWVGIPIALPPELTDILRQAKAENWPDTATAMTMIRNTITHPTKKNRAKYGRHSSDSRSDVWTIGLRNLELCLLRLFEYEGTYGNRITQKHVGEVEFVPWASGVT